MTINLDEGVVVARGFYDDAVQVVRGADEVIACELACPPIELAALRQFDGQAVEVLVRGVKYWGGSRENDERDATLAMAVHRLGGTVEGKPTQRLNFLQRIDELRRIEQRYLAVDTTRDEPAEENRANVPDEHGVIGKNIAESLNSLPPMRAMTADEREAFREIKAKIYRPLGGTPTMADMDDDPIADAFGGYLRRIGAANGMDAQAFAERVLAAGTPPRDEGEATASSKDDDSSICGPPDPDTKRPGRGILSGLLVEMFYDPDANGNSLLPSVPSDEMLDGLCDALSSCGFFGALRLVDPSVIDRDHDKCVDPPAKGPSEGEIAEAIRKEIVKIPPFPDSFDIAKTAARVALDLMNRK